jgi:AcrR family transcriptional regulator
MTKSPVSEQTRIAILDAAWKLVAERGRLDSGQSEIAARAGVSRQTVYLAFGGRAGLLRAMLRNHDRRSPQVARLTEVARGTGDRAEDLFAYVEAWIEYLPEIYPVGIHLDAASLGDAEAAAAWDDRMKTALLSGVRAITGRLEAAGRLASGCTAMTAADLAWSLIHPTAWRLLVVERGWSPEAFRASRIDLIRRALLASPGAPQGATLASTSEAAGRQPRQARRKKQDPPGPEPGT